MSEIPQQELSYEKLPKRTLVVWECFSAMACVVLYFLVDFITRSGTLLQALLFWLVGAIFILSGMLYLPLLYLNVQYRFGPGEVVLKSGLFVERNQVIRRENISFVTQYTAPFARFFRLSSLVIHAPGAKLRLLFVDAESANEIRQQIDRGFDTASS